MLINLFINNFILIDKIEVNFNKGLTSIIGETGSGKSIILKAISYLFKKKLSSDIVKDKTKITSIIAEFDISHNNNISEYLYENGFANENDTILIIRRIINNSSKKNKIFINDQIATSEHLTVLSKQLFDICSQHNHTILLDSNSHIKILDEYLNIGENIKLLEGIYYKLKKLQNEKLKTEESIKKSIYEKSYLNNLLQELTDLNIETDELKNLEIKRKKISEKLRIDETCNLAINILHEKDKNVIEEFWSLHKQMSKLPDVFQEHLNSLEPAIQELESIYQLFQDTSSDLENNSYDINDIEQRFFKIKELESKYKTPSEKFYNLMQDSKNKFELLEENDDVLQKIEKQITKTENEYFDLANSISDLRKKGTHKLRENILSNIQYMNMDRADIKITINKKNEISKDGIDNVDILLKTNPEAEFLTIKKIASGGELSRLMLALKLIQGKTNKVKTIIFDEIDSGIGGHTALLTGEKLKTLSEKIQVILITHQAQIASISDNLLLVTKKHTDNTTTISTHYLNSKERKIELECMITGKRKNT